MLEALLVTAGTLMAAAYVSSRIAARRIRRNRIKAGRASTDLFL